MLSFTQTYKRLTKTYRRLTDERFTVFIDRGEFLFSLSLTLLVYQTQSICQEFFCLFSISFSTDLFNIYRWSSERWCKDMILSLSIALSRFTYCLPKLIPLDCSRIYSEFSSGVFNFLSQFISSFI